MNKTAKILVLLGAVAPLAVFGVSPDQPASTNSGSSTDKLQSLFADSIVVKGKGVEVKRNDLDAEVVSARANYAAHQAPAPPNLEQQALRGLVIEQLVLNKATDADRAGAKKDFESRLTTLKTSRGWTDEQLDKFIGAQLFGGQTREQWEKKSINTLTVPVVLERELGIKITDDDARKFYDDPKNISKLEQPETVRVSHILLMTSDPQTHEALSDEKKAEKRKQMEDILKRARAGEDFAKLADQYSEDPGVKENHGEYKLSRRDPFVPEFKDTAFSLTNVGQISDIITSQYGYHIIKLSEKIPAKKVDFDKVKDQIKDLLTQQAIDKQLRPYIAKLKTEADVKILDDNLKDTDLLPPVPQEEDKAQAKPPQTQK
jgi:peptidyl-prolyl cis-trans isomerase C